MQDERCYHVLGLAPGTDRADVKKAYRRLVLRYHPDLNPDPDAHEQFLRVHEAYHALMSALEPDRYVYRYVHQTVCPFEKYRYVYSAPTDPAQYAEWVVVARARARLQAHQRYEKFVQHRQALKSSWYYRPVKWSTYLCYLLFFVIGAAFALMPVVGVALEQDAYQALFFSPFLFSGIWVFHHAAGFKRSVLDVYFRD